MKIKFDTTSNNIGRALSLGSILFLGIGPLNVAIQFRLDNAHASRFNSSISNLTAIQIGFFCGIPYDDCLCSVQSTKNERLEHCLNDYFLLLSRIVPLLSFVLQIWLVQDLFTFSGNYIRFVANSLWITASFTCVIIANGIYQDSCFHRIISAVSFLTGGLLFVLVYTYAMHNRDAVCSSCNVQNVFHGHIDDTSDDETTEEIENEPILWRDLL